MRRKGVAESCASSTAMRRRRRLHRRHPRSTLPTQPNPPNYPGALNMDTGTITPTSPPSKPKYCCSPPEPPTAAPAPRGHLPGSAPETPLSGADPVAPTAGIRTARGVAGTARWWCRAWCVLRTGSAPAGCVWLRCAVCVGCPAGTIPSWAARCRLVPAARRHGGLRVSGGRDKAGRHD